MKSKDDMLNATEEMTQPSELAEYAARAAAEQLAGNWECALRDGYKLADLLKDVDATIIRLQEWRDSVAEIAAHETRTAVGV